MALILIVTAFYSLVYGYENFFIITPDILFISAIIVMFFGAWYDFGSSSCVKDLQDYYRKSLNSSDLTYINKQQLIMTFIHIGIGGLYMVTGIAIYILSLYILI